MCYELSSIAQNIRPHIHYHIYYLPLSSSVIHCLSKNIVSTSDYYHVYSHMCLSVTQVNQNLFSCCNRTSTREISYHISFYSALEVNVLDEIKRCASVYLRVLALMKPGSAEAANVEVRPQEEKQDYKGYELQKDRKKHIVGEWQSPKNQKESWSKHCGLIIPPPNTHTHFCYDRQSLGQHSHQLSRKKGSLQKVTSHDTVLEQLQWNKHCWENFLPF